MGYRHGNVVPRATRSGQIHDARHAVGHAREKIRRVELVPPTVSALTKAHRRLARNKTMPVATGRRSARAPLGVVHR